MQKDSIQKILFVVNPVSGGKGKNDLQGDIQTYFKELPHVIEFYILKGDNDSCSCSIQGRVRQMNPDKVVAVGGDGTVKLVAEVLRQTSMSVGIVPAGSANGMAKALSIPVNLTEALYVVVNGVCKTIDLIKINDSESCIHLSDIGLNASLIKYFEQSGKRGMWSYAKALLRVLRSNRLMNATIKTDTETVYRKAYMIVVANAAEYGTGAVINPNGYVNDGIFEIVVVRKLTFLSILKMLITHKPFDRQTIEIFHTKHAEVTLAKNACFQVDGEYRGRCKKITAAIAKGCLKVMVPPQPEY